MIDTIRRIILRLDTTCASITNFLNGFFKGASFFRRKMVGGSFASCNLQGGDFRKSSLKDIDMSNIICGRSFLRLVIAGIIATLSICVGLYFSQSILDYLSANGCNSMNSCSNVMDKNILYLFSDRLFIVLFTWSLYYPYLSSSVYSIFLARLANKGICVLTESNRWNFLKIMVIICIPLYLKSFTLALSATVIYYLGVNETINLWSLYFYGSNSEKLIASIVILKGFTNLLSLVIALYIVPTFISTGVLLLNTSFEETKLDGVFFCGAIANNVSFKKAELKFVDFNSALLHFSDFSGSRLKNVNFANANLENAIFTNADLENVIFTGASIDGAHYKKGDMIYHISSIPGLII